MGIAFINGSFCDSAKASISIFDRGFLFGDGVYEVLPVYHKKPFFVDQHIERLQANLEKIKINTPPYSWQEIIDGLITRNDGEDFQIYIQVTRGNQGARKHDIPKHLEPTVIAFTLHTPYPTFADKEKGLSAKLLDDIRWLRCDIKSTSLLGNILLNDEAVSSGYQTSILSRDHFVTEGSTSNVFIVDSDQVIKTPALTHLCLPGISRQITIELINKMGCNFIEGPIHEDELFTAKEVWITSTTKEIYPVTQINDTIIGNGRGGMFWNMIEPQYQQLIYG